jgi:tungstate transport system permease protein
VDIYLDAAREGVGLLASGTVDVWTIVLTSLRVSGTATALALLLGIPAGFLLGTRRTVARWFAVVIANAGMGLPPVVVGLVIAMAFSRRGPLGDLDLLYTPAAMVIAQLVIAVPVVAAVTGAAVGGVPRDLRRQARSLGASRLHEAWLTLKEARLGVFAAIAAGFGAVISEVGASQMVGGNLAGSTRVMTTAIVQYTRMGRYGPALALGTLLLALVVVVNVLLTGFQTSGERYEKG